MRNLTVTCALFLCIFVLTGASAPAEQLIYSGPIRGGFERPVPHAWEEVTEYRVTFEVDEDSLVETLATVKFEHTYTDRSLPAMVSHHLGLYNEDTGELQNIPGANSGTNILNRTAHYAVVSSIGTIMVSPGRYQVRLYARSGCTRVPRDEPMVVVQGTQTVYRVRVLPVWTPGLEVRFENTTLER